jgi:hypothetical protein
VLARNEVERDYAYNRRLVARVRYGRYLPNPAIKIRLADTWVATYEHLNLPLLRRLPPKIFDYVAEVIEHPRRNDDPPGESQEDAEGEVPVEPGPSQGGLF